jgi:hypothetical protein
MADFEPHQQRVVDEKSELDEKINKLRAFFDTDVFSGLDAAERVRLDMQCAVMSVYSDILGKRIAAF